MSAKVCPEAVETNPPQSTKPPVWGIWLVLVIWLVSVFIVQPLGNFPLNDDWSFGLAVKHLIANHDFRPTGWTAMPLLTNVLWGGLFCLPAGFSFTALRLSTLVAALLGMIGVYSLLKLSRPPEWLALMAALLLGFNPIFYPLSFTFMTDVLFLALLVFAAIFLQRNLKTGANSDLFLGTALVVVATLSRQLALAVPVAFAIAACLKSGFNRRQLWRAFFPITVGIIALIIFQQWMSATGRLSPMYRQTNGDLIKALTRPLHTLPLLAHNFYVALLYLGLFLSPILFCVLISVWKAQKKRAQLLFAMSLWILFLAFFCYRSRGFFMPLSGNILADSGIGPFTLFDTFFLHINQPPQLPSAFWKIATFLSLFGAASFTTLLGLIIWDLKLRPRALNDAQVTTVFHLLSATIYLAPLLLTVFSDRYLIPAIPFFIAAIVAAFPPLPRLNLRVFAPVAAILAALMLFSVCSTRDYLAWNRARWTAANDLMAHDHVAPSEMDGGFEFNGFYLFDPAYKSEGKASWWWVQRDTYVLSFGPVPGYDIIKEYPYTHWLPPYTGKVLASKKSTTTPTPPSSPTHR
jgi:uncharacterized membrane protein